MLFTMAITFSALNGGFGPGLLATALSLILAAFAIFEPRGLIALADHVADDVYYSPTLRKIIDLPEDR